MSAQVVVVDGLPYQWWVDETDVAALWMHVDGEGVQVSFVWKRAGANEYGWWRLPSGIDRIVERAVRIARTRGWTDDDAREAIDGPLTTVFDELASARMALGRWPREFAVAMLAVGCAHGDDREAIDDWVATNADVLATAGGWLHAVLEIDGTDEVVYRYRSAIEFLVEMTSRLNVSVGVSTEAADAALSTRRPIERRPWGIPASHWWWLLRSDE